MKYLNSIKSIANGEPVPNSYFQNMKNKAKTIALSNSSIRDMLYRGSKGYKEKEKLRENPYYSEEVEGDTKFQINPYLAPAATAVINPKILKFGKSIIPTTLPGAMTWAAYDAADYLIDHFKPENIAQRHKDAYTEEYKKFIQNPKLYNDIYRKEYQKITNDPNYHRTDNGVRIQNVGYMNIATPNDIYFDKHGNKYVQEFGREINPETTKPYSRYKMIHRAVPKNIKVEDNELLR